MRWVCELDGESVVDVWELRDDEDELMKLDLVGGGGRFLRCIATAFEEDGQHGGTAFHFN